MFISTKSETDVNLEWLMKSKYVLSYLIESFQKKVKVEMTLYLLLV